MTAIETGAVIQVSNAWPATKEDEMSSIALNSRNITMISRLLREARKPGDTQDLRTDAARYLARRFQEGTRDEGRLEIALRQFIKKHRRIAKAVDRWDDEGEAVKNEK